MAQEIIDALAGAMTYCQVDVCGVGMFQAPRAAKEVISVLEELGFVIVAAQHSVHADLASAWVTECPVCHKVLRCLHDLENTPSR